MGTLKRYGALFAVLACIGAGCLLLMFDYDTLTSKWAALIGAVMFIAAGFGLGHLFNRHNMMPE